MTLDDFNHESNLSIVEENVDTLGGYIFSKINRVPYAGEVIKVDNTYQFEIIEADPRKIKKIRIFKIL
jgi:magnesium and cobalt transporter